MIHGIGSCARLVADLLISASLTDDAAVASAGAKPFTSAGVGGLPTAPNLDRVILLSRNADLVSPLCSQLIYGGLVDDVFGFNGSQVTSAVALFKT